MRTSSNPVQFHENIQRHRQALQTTLPTVAHGVATALSYRLVAVICDLHDTALIRNWAAGDITVQNPEAERRLRTAYEILLLLRPHDGDEIIRAWFLGMGPTLNDVSPASVIREGRFTDAIGAAHAFIAEG